LELLKDHYTLGRGYLFLLNYYSAFSNTWQQNNAHECFKLSMCGLYKPDRWLVNISEPQLASEPKVTVESDGRDLQSQAEDGCDEIIEVLKYSEKAMKRLLEEAEAPLQIKVG